MRSGKSGELLGCEIRLLHDTSCGPFVEYCGARNLNVFVGCRIFDNVVSVVDG